MEWNIFSRSCPSRTSLAQIANKWTAMIVISLVSGPKRFGELHSHVEGISKKVLTDTLRALERDGMLERSEGRYALTPLGESLEEPLRALQTWAESHIEVVLENRDRYDAAEDDAILGADPRAGVNSAA
ncbi:transcriptional regulator [Mycetocola tolaasinivorans]|uniref:Transcriptional regulator n=1 Tax=Mycetocola tolaasinivorans TaxID=76635 RepID=A0A3L7A9H4_9MICO|nr:helix-turn-helix domain-containing protein [Mycetocola tolaasinivorans]RLP76827.1 transcriptional regulator [Mycetocola tolaasinivorans]